MYVYFQTFEKYNKYVYFRSHISPSFRNTHTETLVVHIYTERNRTTTRRFGSVCNVRANKKKITCTSSSAHVPLPVSTKYCVNMHYYKNGWQAYCTVCGTDLALRPNLFRTLYVSAADSKMMSMYHFMHWGHKLRIMQIDLHFWKVIVDAARVPITYWHNNMRICDVQNNYYARLVLDRNNTTNSHKHLFTCTCNCITKTGDKQNSDSSICIPYRCVRS